VATETFVKGFNDGGGMFAEEKDGSIWFSHWIKGISKLTFNEQLDAFTEELFDTEKGFYTNRNNVFLISMIRSFFPVMEAFLNIINRVIQ